MNAETPGEPWVSVRVITYNHERYIRQCLEGILAQRTTFPFEVVVGEDCSTDATGTIARDYADRFPGRVRLITSGANVGGRANALRVLAACRGRYHALCEGDDCWIDPLKLQKQVDFLESHPDFTLCFHDVLILSDEKRFAPKYACPPDLPGEPTMEDFVLRPTFAETVSLMLRRTVYDDMPDWRHQVWCPDEVVRLWCAHKGRAGYLGEVMAIYRYNPLGLNAVSHRDPWKVYGDLRRLYEGLDRETGGRYGPLLRRKRRRLPFDFLGEWAKRKAPWLYPLVRIDKTFGRLVGMYRASVR